MQTVSFPARPVVIVVVVVVIVVVVEVVQIVVIVIVEVVTHSSRFVVAVVKLMASSMVTTERNSALDFVKLVNAGNLTWCE